MLYKYNCKSKQFCFLKMLIKIRLHSYSFIKLQFSCISLRPRIKPKKKEVKLFKKNCERFFL